MSSYRNLLLLILSLSFVPLFTACDPTPLELWREGIHYQYADLPDDEEQEEYNRLGYECFKKAAEQDYSPAYYDLALCYYEGKGVTKDFEQAVKWFYKTVREDDLRRSNAQLNLGDCYFFGRGVSKDFVEAAKWYRLAAEDGHSKARLYLGNCYFFGTGVVEDKEKAVFWYRKAATENDDEFSIIACSELGRCYAFGYGVPKDIQKAIELWQKAVKWSSDAQYYLGVCYAEGLGVPKDLEKAVELLHEADKRGHEKAGEVLDQLTNRGY